jgi:hypothetical protein
MTDFVSCFNSPSGPVNDKPCCLAIRTSSVAACCSAVISVGFLLATSSSVAVMGLHPSSPSDPLSVSGHKHRYVDTPQHSQSPSRPFPRLVKSVKGDIGEKGRNRRA